VIVSSPIEIAVGAMMMDKVKHRSGEACVIYNDWLLDVR
jgi:hypothetical protein